MTIQPVTPQTTTANAQQAAPETKSAEAASATASTSAPVAKADSVTLSKQAILMNSRGYSAGEEATESPAAKAAEKTKGQR